MWEVLQWISAVPIALWFWQYGFKKGMVILICFVAILGSLVLWLKSDQFTILQLLVPMMLPFLVVAYRVLAGRKAEH